MGLSRMEASDCIKPVLGFRFKYKSCNLMKALHLTHIFLIYNFTYLYYIYNSALNAVFSKYCQNQRFNFF